MSRLSRLTDQKSHLAKKLSLRRQQTRRCLLELLEPRHLMAGDTNAGVGLLAQYYNNSDFTDFVLARTDSSIAFNWGAGSPDGSIGADTFSVRWSGQVEAVFTENYSFIANADNGLRLWVNGKLLIDRWTEAPVVGAVGTISLVSGRKYDILFEYFETTGNASVQLDWSSASQLQQTLPSFRLFPSERGNASREIWNNVAGTSVAALTGLATYPSSPSTVVLTNGLQSPTNQADNFGERLRGLIYPPQTGEYTFYIAGDDTAELWLSSSSNALGKQRIATVPSSTLANEWTKFPEQRSSVYRLVAGQAYYVEALHKEGIGPDHLAVGWVTPGGSNIDLIRGEYLSPALPEVELFAERPETAEGATEPARLRVVRRGTPINNALTVSYALRGTALNGIDFASLPGTVIIPAGQDYAFIDIASITDSINEGTETSIIELVDAPGYQLGLISQRTATATIQDNVPTPAGGLSLLAGTALGTHFSSFGGTFTTVNDTTPPGSVASPITAIQASITTKPANPWDAQLRQPISGPVKKGDILFAEFLVRTVSGSGSISAIFERNGTPFTKSLDRGLNFSTTWTKVQLPFVSSEDYVVGEATFGFHLGGQVQSIRFAAFNVRNYGPSSELAPSTGLELNNIGGVYGTMQSVAVTGQTFANASLITTVTTPPDSWRLQAVARSAAAVQTGDTLQVEFWARGITGASPRLDIVVQESYGSFTTLSFNSRTLTSNWQKYTFNLTTTQAYGVAKLQATLNVGFAPQSVQVGGFKWTNLTRGYAFSAMPTQSPSSSYIGREGTDSWRTDADTRINQNRAADLTVQVRDSNGSPIDGAVVTIRQKKNAFAFGTAVSGYSNLLSSTGGAEALKYQAEIKRLFNTVVVENNLKWPDFQNNRQLGIDAANWAVANGLKLRGHNVIWPSRTYMPSSVWSQYDTLLSSQGATVAATYLRNTINARIVDAADTFEGKAFEWDIVNEPYTNNDAMSVLGNDELLEWFRLFRASDPLARRTLNEYDIFSRNGGNTSHRANFDYWLGRLKSQNLIETIGEQSHYGEANLTDMSVLAQLIQTYSTTYGLPIAITEFDVNTSNEQLQADYLRDYLTMTYSQAGIAEFLQWGFWSKSHWLPQASLFRDDFSIKPNGQVYEDLVFGDWWTDTRGTTFGGQFQARGTLGDYEVIVVSNGQEVVSNTTLTAGASTLQVVVPGNRVPTSVQLSNRRIAENSPVNSLVGTLTATDPDAANTHTFALVSGLGSTDNQAFTILGNQLRTNATFDFEARSAYSVRIRATDQGGLAKEQVITIQVENLLESSGMRTDLVVPLYEYPTFANGARTQLSGWWQDIASTASSAQPITVVINPSSGPIDPQSIPLATDYQIYVDALRLLRANPYVRTLGYVPTGYGSRAFSQISQFLDWYASGYKDTSGGSLIDGVFLDEYMADSNQLNYYRTIRDAIRSRDLLAGKYIMANPGTAIALNTYYTEPVADSFVSYENMESPTAVGSVTLANSVVPANAASGVEFDAIIHSVASAAEMQRVAKIAKSKGYGQLFITNDVLGNPYDMKPTYWDALIIELHRPVIVPQSFSISEASAVNTLIGTLQGFDPDPGQTLTYSISQGNIGNGFSISPSGNLSVASGLDYETIPSYSLTVQATDSSAAALVDTATVTVQLTDFNEAVILTAVHATVNGNVLSTLTNSGTWRDPEAGVVTLTASLGSVDRQSNGTWNWSYNPNVKLVNQIVTIQANDSVNTSSVSFTINAIPAVTNRQLYYKDSSYSVGGTDVQAALDPSKVIAKSGTSPQTLSYANLTNTTRGINGVVLDVAGLVSSSLTASDFSLRMSPTGFFDESTSPPNSWVAAPAPTGISVTPGSTTTPARVRLEWADNAIANRWLQIQILANSKTGLPITEVYYLGHLRGEINGQIIGGAYFVNNADLTAALPVGQAATVGNNRDVDKNGFVLNADFIVMRSGIIDSLVLRNITIPTAGSSDEGAVPGNAPSIPTAPFAFSSSWVEPPRVEQSMAINQSNSKPQIGLTLDAQPILSSPSLSLGSSRADLTNLSKAKTLTNRKEFLRKDAVFSELGKGNFEKKLRGLENS